MTFPTAFMDRLLKALFHLSLMFSLRPSSLVFAAWSESQGHTFQDFIMITSYFQVQISVLVVYCCLIAPKLSGLKQ